VLNPSAPSSAARPMASWLQHLYALPRDGRDTIFLLVVIGWVLVPQTANLPLWCSALSAAILCWRGWLAWGSRPLPSRWWLFGLLGLTLAATLFTHRSVLGRDAGVTLIVVLLTLKTLELRARRDAFVVFFLGFFTMLTNFFFSQSLLTAAAMLVGLLGLLTALVNAHMPVGRPPLKVAAKTAASMALIGAPIMVVLFMLFPRLAPLWGIPSDALAGRSGLSSTMQIGNIATLALDESVAMRIKFEGPPPRANDLYFRGPVLSYFDGREWRHNSIRLGARLGTRLLQGQKTMAVQVDGPPVRYEATVEPSNRPWLMVLDMAATAPELPGHELRITNEMQWFSDRPLTDVTRYKAESYPNFRYGPTAQLVVPPEYRELPVGFDPRTQQLAQEMMRDPALRAGGSSAMVDSALRRLKTGGYRYTLEPGVYGEHTADEFWFDRKEGFCEHIASAFVILMRNLNIPARIVTGYQGGERNSVDGLWTVRQSDAHAWAEVWMVDAQGVAGWNRVDPTGAVAPGRTGAFERLRVAPGVVGTAMNAVNPELAASFRAAWEAVNNRWNQWVLNYTQSKQLDLLKNIGFDSPSWEDLAYVLLGILVGVSSVGALWTLWERQRQDPWLRLLHRTCDRLRKAGLDLPAHTPPRLVAEAAQRHFGATATALADWLLLLEAQRYARDPQASLATLQRQYRQLSWPQ
jgi:transglutaminase-like putative cysteine protease